MSFDAGFATVAYVRGELVNAVVRAAHFRNGDHFRTPLSRTFDVGGVPVAVTGPLFLETPRVLLRAADGKARVALSGWARLRAQAEGVDAKFLARLTAEVLVPLAFEEVREQSWRTDVYLDMSRFDTEWVSVTVPWVADASGVSVPQLADGPELRQWLLEAVRPLAQRYLRVHVPIEMLNQMQSNLLVQSFVDTPRVRPTAVRVLDDALAVCFDEVAGAQRKTNGDASRLVQPWREWADRVNEQHRSIGLQFTVDPVEVQVVVAILPSLLLYYGAWNFRIQMGLRPLAADKRVDDLTFALERGAVTMNIKLTKINENPYPDDKVGARVELVIRHDHIHIRRFDIVYNPSGLSGVLDLFGGLVTDYVRQMARDRIGGEVRRANWAFAMARYSGDVPGISGSPGNATVTVAHRGTAIDPSYVLAGIAVTIRNHDPQPAPQADPDTLPAQLLTAPRRDRIKIWPYVPIRERIVRFDVPDHPTLHNDPSMRTRWHVSFQQPDSSAGSFIQDSWSDEPSARVLMLDLWSDDLHAAHAVSITMTHHRPGVGDVRSETIDLRVDDRFRRDLPYVRWHRSISWNEIVDGEVVRISKDRLSAVHKTSIWQRCKFCDTGSNRPVGRSGMQHFDTLPATPDPGFRTELCEYCFR